MSRTNYDRGREIEYKIVKVMEDAGYVAQRSAQSRGAWDVCAIGPQGIRFIQAKRVKKGGSWKGEFEKARELLEFAPDLPNVAWEIWIWEDYLGWIKREVIK